jgi:hypothetical protein
MSRIGMAGDALLIEVVTFCGEQSEFCEDLAPEG